MDAAEQAFRVEGTRLFQGALGRRLSDLLTVLADQPADQAGVRLHGIDSLKAMLDADGCLGAVAATALGPSARPVRAILFNKTVETNWSLGWHQDRTICVKAKREVAGFGPWTVKRGMNHVAPPFALLSRMVTVRAHLDAVPATNAPLLVAPGSHALGRISVDSVHAVVKQCGTKACLAEAGDVWLYATPILHASETATAPGRRRVLQVDYAAEALPDGLEWLGV
jgi:hypothetical protein